MDLSFETARELLLQHARHPHNRVKDSPALAEFPSRGECKNPLCGDHVQVFLKCEGERLRDLRLRVEGCAMCMASASLMSLTVKDLSRSEALHLFTSFEACLLEPEATVWPAPLSALSPLSFLRRNRARIPCALIPWFALKDACRF